MVANYWVALEKKVEAWRNINEHRLIPEMEESMGGIWRALKPEGRLYAFSRGISLAEPYYIDPQICPLIESASETVPDWYIKETDFPSYAGFVWLARPYKIRIEGRGLIEPNLELKAVSWFLFDKYHRDTEGIIREGDQKWIIFSFWTDFPQSGVGIWPFVSTSFEDGESLQGTMNIDIKKGIATEEDFKNSSDIRMTKYLASVIAFINQELFAHTRKACTSRTLNQVPFELRKFKEVNVIELRKRVFTGKQEKGEPLDWDHRWFVSGHWRNQYYPSEKQNRPIWISPYIKGPEDKPLKPKPDRLFAVVR